MEAITKLKIFVRRYADHPASDTVATCPHGMKLSVGDIAAIADQQEALVSALRSMLAATDSSEPELFAGHHNAYLKTVAIPRAKEALAKAGSA